MPAQPWQVEKGIGAALSLLLALPGLGDQGRSAGCIVTGFDRIQRRAFPGYGQMQVDAVQQGPGQFVAIALNHVRCTGATAARFAKIST